MSKIKTREEYLNISVIVPAYNSEKTIERCIESIQNNEVKPKRVMIYNDGSKDGTKDILEKICQKWQNVTIYNSNENKGAGYARAYMLERIDTKYIAFLDSDDEWSEGKLEKQIDFMERGNLDIVTATYLIRSQKQTYVRKPPASLNYRLMLIANWIPMSMTILRADLIGAKSMPKIRRRQDYAYWLKIFRENKSLKYGRINELLGVYNKRAHSLSSNPMKNLKFNYLMFRKTQGFAPIVAASLVFMNVIVRVLRK